ncbi:NAD(P)/FAD-dependent oxidoreductase [Thiocystis violacea]|uniref:NAD(P)/FAD-dependent oxidoreductase n=1 Tax=Thiocystis violacea TaxID=13725 RepID=UPI001908711E|nr:FAD-dependent oxidoreductase [Thiocystis violacea]MBK1716907.1 NAD/FAD-binding protein [Thiocystis violacea]
MALERIGVVGGGIGGLGAAWLLDGRYEVTLLERNDYVGGHTHTLDVEGALGRSPVDTGFMVFNRRNYPLLCALFAHLGVESYPTEMSFAASLDGGRVEYAGTNLNTLFGQRSHLLDWRFMRLLLEIPRFNKAAKSFLDNPEGDPSLGEFLRLGGYSERFATQYLLPMAAAIWSCPTQDMRAFPFRSFARFFANHGLLDLADRPQWETVRGGSRAYVERLLSQFRGQYRTNARVTSVRRSDRGVEVDLADGERLTFDALVMGCHADETLALIESPSDTERELLGSFPYRSNRVYLHSDTTLMPKRRRVWASWNYLQQPGEDPTRPVTVTYWMNSLQDLPAEPNVFVSLNPQEPPRPETILAELDYDHPMFDARALAAQRRMGEIQGRDRLWFSGAWMGYGFHEDGLRSAVEVARGLGVDPPWATSAAETRAPRPESARAPTVLAGVAGS